MRKTITIAALAVVSILYAPHVIGQDTSKVRKEISPETDDEDDVPQAAAHKKKTAVVGTEAPVAGGLLVGLNQASLIIGGGTSAAVNGIVIGGIFDFHLVGVLHLETGLLYAMTGGSGLILNSGTTATFNVNTVELPVTFEFKFGNPGRNHFCLGLGGYVAYNVSGTVNATDGSSGTLAIGSDITDQLKSFDAGIGLDIAYQLKGGLFFRIRGQGGISNLQPYTGFGSETIRTQSASLEIGYLFSAKPKHTAKRNTDDDVEMKM
jgi:hypothetical protein